MGDADSSEVIIPVQVIESMMDSALEEMDDGLEEIFSSIRNISKRMNQIHMELKACERFYRCFTAFSFFVLPVVVAISIAYSAWDDSGKNVRTAGVLQSLISFCMYFSTTIGLPVYILSLWEAFFGKPSELDESEFPASDATDPPDVGGRQGSAELLVGLGRQISQRFPDNIRTGISLLGRINESPMANSSTNPERQDNEQPDNSSVARQESAVPERITRTGIDHGGVRVIILNTTPDMFVEIEKTEEILTEANDHTAYGNTVDKQENVDHQDNVFQQTVGMSVVEEKKRVELDNLSFTFVRNHQHAT